MTSTLSASELDALIQVSKTVNAKLDINSVLELVMSVTTEVMKVEASSLVLVDEETGDLLFHVARGEKADIIKPIRLKQGEGIVGWVIQNRRGVIVNDVKNDPRFYKNVDKKSGFITKSILCVPMETNDKVWGVIEILNKLDDGDFDNHDFELCEAIAAHAAIAIENAKLHEQIIKTERLTAIGQTIAGLAHCIKNVLNGISGGSYILDMGLRKDDTTNIIKGWKIVKKNNSFIQELVLDMLSYSKKREPEYKLVDINEIIGSVCNLMATKAKEKNIDLTWTPSASLKEVMLDEKGIKRCILNLVTNAIDASSKKDDGRVDVFIDVINNKMFSIIISDNGCGIHEKDRKNIFQMFFSTKGTKGTGLGLSLTHNIITEHCGTIDVESEIGKGTKFIVKLPLRKKIDIPMHKSNSVSQI